MKIKCKYLLFSVKAENLKLLDYVSVSNPVTIIKSNGLCGSIRNFQWYSYVLTQRFRLELYLASFLLVGYPINETRFSNVYCDRGLGREKSNLPNA